MQVRQLVRGGLNLYIIIAVLLSAYQFYNYQSTKPMPVSATNSTTPQQTISQEQARTNSLHTHYTVFVTEKLEPTIKELMVQNKLLTSNVQAYTFQGKEWLFQMALNYGHLVVGMYVFSYYNNPQLQRGKKLRIMFIGMAAVFAWTTIAQKLNIERVEVTKGTEIKLRLDKAQFDNATYVQFLNNNRQFLFEDTTSVDSPPKQQAEFPAQPTNPETISSDDQNVYTSDEF